MVEVQTTRVRIRRGHYDWTCEFDLLKLKGLGRTGPGQELQSVTLNYEEGDTVLSVPTHEEACALQEELLMLWTADFTRVRKPAKGRVAALEKIIKREKRIVDLICSIMGNGTLVVETINEAVLVKLLELRGTPIPIEKTFRDIEADYEREEREYQERDTVGTVVP